MENVYTSSSPTLEEVGQGGVCVGTWGSRVSSFRGIGLRRTRQCDRERGGL